MVNDFLGGDINGRGKFINCFRERNNLEYLMSIILKEFSNIGNKEVYINERNVYQVIAMVMDVILGNIYYNKNRVSFQLNIPEGKACITLSLTIDGCVGEDIGKVFWDKHNKRGMFEEQKEVDLFKVFGLLVPKYYIKEKVYWLGLLINGNGDVLDDGVIIPLVPKCWQFNREDVDAALRRYAANEWD